MKRFINKWTILGVLLLIVVLWAINVQDWHQLWTISSTPDNIPIVAMLFLIFDVETIFLLPWAIIFMGNDFSFTKFALIEMFVFIGILIVGYYYAWRKGALEWA